METTELITKVKKRITKVNTTKHAEFIEEIVPDLLEFVEGKTNNSFRGDVPGPVLLFIAKAIEYNMNPTGLEARTLGDVSYNYETDFPKSIMRYLRPYKKVKLHG